ncbi:MAG: DUF86 domain-containing protein [Bacteroidales bacterium]|jgi:uncharacterized protein with HEPN domain|nr:DUF86 domain-containing protein [Bacteroidales bacterium]
MKKNNKIDNLARLEHISNSIRLIRLYTEELDEVSFLENKITQDAVLYQFSVIGEAINHVDREILDKFEYPWYKVRSFRNLIAHEYFNIKLTAVWNVIINELTELENMIQKIINNVNYGFHESLKY